MEAMRTALTLANHPRAGAPPPPQFCDAQISVRDLHRAVSQADARKEAYDVKQPFNQPPIYPHYQLDVQLPPGHPVRSMSLPERVRYNGIALV